VYAQSITPVPVTPNNFVLAGNGRGEVIASWYSFESPANHNVVRAAVKSASGTAFGASRVISDPTRDTYDSPMVLDPNGDAVAGLPLGPTGGPLGVEAVVFDGAPPRLGTPTGPASLLKGAKASFSVPRSTDVLSAVSSIRWSFGDGSASATGLAVSHTFARTGRFTVKVTATDAAGNAASKSLAVTVRAKTRCVVPNIKGKTLSRARTLLTRAHCRLGQVHKPKHHKHRKLVVSKTSPGAGQTRPAGTKVAVTLKPKSP
jgi:PKD domain